MKQKFDLRKMSKHWATFRKTALISLFSSSDFGPFSESAKRSFRRGSVRSLNLKEVFKILDRT